MDSIWKMMSSGDMPTRVSDEKGILYAELTAEIDESFETWRQSPWKSEVDFSTFCNYILPYRVMNETYKAGWKNVLYEKYHSLVNGVADLKTAFFIVHDSISRQVRRSAYQYPYQFNTFEMEYVMKGNCLQRCIYEVAVMRSLGIPAAIDGIDFWSNYSKNGHTWVALVPSRIASGNSSCQTFAYAFAQLFAQRNCNVGRKVISLQQTNNNQAMTKTLH